MAEKLVSRPYGPPDTACQTCGKTAWERIKTGKQLTNWIRCSNCAAHGRVAMQYRPGGKDGR